MKKLLTPKDDWESVRLGKIADMYAGGTPSTKNKEFWGGEIPWIQSGLIQNNYIELKNIDARITEKGLQNKAHWQALADKYGLKINQWGIPALAGFTFDSPNALAYKTYITQEMLKKGYIAGTLMYTCMAHTDEILNGYYEALDPIFADIRDFEDGKDVMKALEGPVCQSGFKRLN